MKYLLLLFIVSGSAYAGGSLGGGGLGKASLFLSLTDRAGLVESFTVPDLGLTEKTVSMDQYRRARIRLSLSGDRPLEIDSIAVKAKSGGVVDLLESFQIVPDTANHPTKP